MQLIDNIVYCTADELVEYGVSHAYIKKALLTNRRGAPSWAHIADPTDNRRKLIELGSIPPATVRKYSLPDPDEVRDSLLVAKQQRPNNEMSKRIAHALEYGWTDWVPYYEAYDRADCKQLAQAAAVCMIGLQIRNQRGYKQQLAAWVEEVRYADLKYLKISSLDYARQRLNHAANEVSVLSLVKKKLEGNNNRRKWDDLAMAFIEMLYASSNTITNMMIAERMRYLYTKVYGMSDDKVPTLAVIKRHTASKEVQQRWVSVKSGSKAAYMRVIPPVTRLMATAPCDLWMADGTRLMLWYQKDGKPTHKNIYLLLDTYSTKIVGYSLDDFENANSIGASFALAIKTTNQLPLEIMHDNSSGMKTDRVKMLIENCAMMGCHWTAAPVGAPNYKAQVERFFRSFQSRVLNQCPNYTGEGIRSKTKNAHPNPEVMAKYFANKGAMLPSEEQLYQQVAELVTLHNNKPLGPRRPSPNQLYSEPKPRAVLPNKALMVQANIKPRRITVSRSQLVVHHNEQPYYYSLGHGLRAAQRATLQLDLNNETVEVYFDPEHRDTVEVFTLGGGKHLCAAALKQQAPASMAMRQQYPELEKELCKQINEQKAIDEELERQRKEVADRVAGEMDKLSELQNYRITQKEYLDPAETEALLDMQSIAVRTTKPVLPAYDYRDELEHNLKSIDND